VKDDRVYLHHIQDVLNDIAAIVAAIFHLLERDTQAMKERCVAVAGELG